MHEKLGVDGDEYKAVDIWFRTGNICKAGNCGDNVAKFLWFTVTGKQEQILYTIFKDKEHPYFKVAWYARRQAYFFEEEFISLQRWVGKSSRCYAQLQVFSSDMKWSRKLTRICKGHCRIPNYRNLSVDVFARVKLYRITLAMDVGVAVNDWINRRTH